MPMPTFSLLSVSSILEASLEPYPIFQNRALCNRVRGAAARLGRPGPPNRPCHHSQATR